ncbi:MAG: Na+/H+ antiporter subunit E [Gammaproteobacteria bacterium]|nr:Na+/H+ antiporter subunit E [Gammaproteobacteria bacterium]
MPNSTNIPLQFLNLWLTLFLIWMIANASLASDTVITGVIVSAVIALAFASFSGVYSVIRWSPRVIFYYLRYLSVFSIELVKANINVMLLVFSPRINIKPGIVEIKTDLKSPIGRMALANTITLTPGTLVVDIKDDSLFIHCINIGATDQAEATAEISGRFEKLLKVIYG